jgi:hypothetical protein
MLESKKFFNQVSLLKESNKPVGYVDTTSKKLIEALAPLNDELNSLEFVPVAAEKTVLKSRFNGMKGMFGAQYHKAETATHLIEVIDTNLDHKGANTYSLTRRVLILEKDAGEQARNVFIELSSNQTPAIYLETADTTSIRFYHAPNKDAATAMATQLIDALEEKVPRPEWVTNFDQKFQIVGKDIRTVEMA